MKCATELLEQQLFEDDVPIAAVGGVVYRLREGQAELLLIRKRQGFWTLPKGQVKPGESEHDALAREVREETGIDSEIEAQVQQVAYIVQKAGRPRRKVVTYYLLRAGTGVLQPGVQEGIEFVRWFSFRAALRRIRRKRIREIVRAAQALLEQEQS
jgi:8-oxo-dGTP diphosphatase